MHNERREKSLEKQEQILVAKEARISFISLPYKEIKRKRERKKKHLFVR